MNYYLGIIALFLCHLGAVRTMNKRTWQVWVWIYWPCYVAGSVSSLVLKLMR